MNMITGYIHIEKVFLHFLIDHVEKIGCNILENN